MFERFWGRRVDCVTKNGHYIGDAGIFDNKQPQNPHSIGSTLNNTFIEKIYVYEAEKTDEGKTQRIKIVYNMPVLKVYSLFASKSTSRKMLLSCSFCVPFLIPDMLKEKHSV